jgi:hypothetical protein
MARPKLDTPLVRPEAARFVWRDAFLEVLAEEPVLEDRTVTVLAALRSRCSVTVAGAYDALVDECLETLASKDLSVRDASYVWSWCCEELDGGQPADPHFPDGTILAAKLRRPGASVFVDGFRCAGDIRGAVETVRAFLASIRLTAPKGSTGPWWLLQCSLAALLPGMRADRFAWWRQDWNPAAVALDNGPVAGRINVVAEPGEDPRAFAHRVSVEAKKTEEVLDAWTQAGIVKDPRVGLDTRPLRWAVLSRCGGASTEAIAKAAGCTSQAVLKAVAQVEKRVGLVL